MPDDYYKGVGTLAPTDGIKDPQVRAFCDSLANVWQLRNGVTGSDSKQRFITQQEWDFLAKNPNIRALAGIGQPGTSPQEPGPGGPGPHGDTGPVVIPPWIQNLIDYLTSGITLIDFTEIYRKNNEMFAISQALTTEVRNSISSVQKDIDALEEGIHWINTITEDSESESAKAVFGLKQRVGTSEADIIWINTVDVNSESANAKQTALIKVTADNAGIGTGLNTAAIIQINEVNATSTSANATRLQGIQADIGFNPVTGKSWASATIAEIENVSLSSQSVNAQKTATMEGQLGTQYGQITHLEKIVLTNDDALVTQVDHLAAYSGLKARVFAQPNEPVSTAGYTIVPGDLWIDTAHDNIMKIRNVTNDAWVDASDKRIAGSGAGYTSDKTARVSSDSALATQLNVLWSYVGNNNALVYDNEAVTVNQYAGSATKFEQVQAAVTNPATGQIYTAAIKQEYDTYVSSADAKARAMWALKAQVEVGGRPVITGMTLVSEIDPAYPYGKSAVIFLCDNFGITTLTDPAIAGQVTVPFIVTKGEDGISRVRMNIVHIGDYIQSDIWVPRQRGWIIDKNGNAEFNGVSLFGSVYSGSNLIDRTSGQLLCSIASGMYTGGKDNALWPVEGPTCRLVGPNYHTQYGQAQRVREGWVTVTLSFSGVADHAISIWTQENDGNPIGRAQTTTPAQSYGAVSITWVGMLYFSPNSYYDFMAASTYVDHVSPNPSKPYIESWVMTVTAANL